jgi:acylphosphatase
VCIGCRFSPERVLAPADQLLTAYRFIVMQDPSTIIARRCFVAGRVQGVFYRASTRQKALELGCSGYARNLADGRVEVLAVGKPVAVHALIDWLWRGPPAAHVTGVEVHEVELHELGQAPAGFVTGRD